MSYRFDFTQPVDAEIRRIALEEIDAAVAFLESAPSDRPRALHGARKRLKRLRGLVKLLRPADKDFHDRENTRFRDIARSLSKARDADALLETVDRFAASRRGPRAAEELAVIRAYLERRRDRIVHAEEQAEDPVPAAIASLREARADFGEDNLAHLRKEGAAILSRGTLTMRDKARKALARARRHGDAEDFHTLRKAVKYHWMHLGLMEQTWPGDVRKRRRRANRLGDRLGELNDIETMARVLSEEAAEIVAPEAVATFRKLLAKSEKALRKRCLRKAEKLLEDGKGRTTRKLERAIRKEAA